LLKYAAAAMLAVPVGAVAWFEVIYLMFGLTGDDPSVAIKTAVVVLVVGSAFGWPLYRARRAAEVVQRSCRLGIVVAMMLPVVAVAVLVLWQNASGRRDLGMGGLMLFSLPLVALGISAVLIVFFWLGQRLAARRLIAEA
jgi:hypothetical protein